MTPIRCFLVQESGLAQIFLRKYTFNSSGVCPGSGHGHNASVAIGERQIVLDAEGYIEPLNTPHDDPRWPVKCDHCDFVFEGPDVIWQTNQHRIFEAPEGRWIQSTLPVGAMFYASWMQPVAGEEYSHDYVCPTEGSVLSVICPLEPDGSGRMEWCIDAYCSNCDRKGQPHHCWCRHGVAPDITVDKTAPDALGTCSAGGGSIWCKHPHGWHGFLQGGYLRKA